MSDLPEVRGMCAIPNTAFQPRCRSCDARSGRSVLFGSDLDAITRDDME